jgi:hypothetical protein
MPKAKRIDRSPDAAAARVDQIRELAEMGASIPQIAQQLGITESGCRRITAKRAISVPAERIVGNTRRLSADRILEQTVIDAEGLTLDTHLIDFALLDRNRLRDWIRRLLAAREQFAQFVLRLQVIERREDGSRSSQCSEAASTHAKSLQSRDRSNASANGASDAA